MLGVHESNDFLVTILSLGKLYLLMRTLYLWFAPLCRKASNGTVIQKTTLSLSTGDHLSQCVDAKRLGPSFPIEKGAFLLSLFLPLPRWKGLYCFSGPTQNDGGIAVFYKWTETEHCTRKALVWLFLGTVCRILKYHVEVSYAKSVNHNLEIINTFLAKTSKTGEASSEIM